MTVALKNQSLNLPARNANPKQSVFLTGNIKTIGLQAILNVKNLTTKGKCVERRMKNTSNLMTDMKNVKFDFAVFSNPKNFRLPSFFFFYFHIK